MGKTLQDMAGSSIFYRYNCELFHPAPRFSGSLCHSQPGLLKLSPGRTRLQRAVVDLAALWERCQRLVVSQQVTREEDAKKQAKDTIPMSTDSGLRQEPIPLLFHRGSPRVFYILPQERHKAIIGEPVAGFLAKGWERHGHFERVTP